jgi:hypothetical protein
MKNLQHLETLKKHINSTVIASMILGLSFIFGIWTYGQRSNVDETITITGSAKETVMSDLATYGLTFDKTYPASMDLQKVIEDFEKKSFALV